MPFSRSYLATVSVAVSSLARARSACWVNQAAFFSAYLERGIFGVSPFETIDPDGVGRFYDDEEWNGRPIRVRYTWTVASADSCRWEQALVLLGHPYAA